MPTIDDLRSNFLTPPQSYGLLPLWDLNNDLPPEDIQWGLAEQAKQGVAGVFLHPRSGMEVEYLSEDYWRAIESSIEECKSLGLETWLYDEYNWPSGVAGGKLLREHPEYRQVYLDYRKAQCASGETCELIVPPTAHVLAARAWRVGSDEVLDVMSAVQDNVLRWTSPHSPQPPLPSPGEQYHQGRGEGVGGSGVRTGNSPSSSPTATLAACGRRAARPGRATRQVRSTSSTPKPFASSSA